ncbi:MAG: DNA polymerase I, partial [Ilumatobacteraceae bacterium]
MASRSTTDRRRLLVLDGNSLAYRAFFAVPDTMATSSGQVTNAVYGFSNMLVSLLKDHRPAGLAVAFDRPEPTFRHVAEPTYKAQRESAPDILRQQMGIVRELLVAAGVPVLEVAGFEADDVIATMADRAVDEGWDVVVVTGDRDSFQLVRDPHVRVLYNKRGVSDVEMYDEAGILGRTVVTARQYPMYAAMRGDPSDNLPGVPGVGEKTAAKLIAQYGDLDGIYAHLDELTPKLRESLAANEERARKNVDLMTLRHDAPIEIDPDDLHLTPNGVELRRFCEFLEFKNLFQRFVSAFGALGVELANGDEHRDVDVGSDRGTEISGEHEICADAESVARLATSLATSEVFDVAPVWTAEPGRSSLRGLAVATGDLVHWVDSGPLAALGELLVKHSFRALDAKPLLRALLDIGVDAKGLSLDVAIAAYLLDPSSTKYGLSEIVERHGDFRLPGRRVPEGQLDLDGSGADDDVRLATVEARAIGLVSPVLRERLAAEGMADLYDEIENPLVRVLARMEHIGIAVDADALRTIARRLTEEVETLSASLKELAGSTFNPNSPAQLSRILFEERGLTPPKKTKTGFSTDAATLEKLRDEWPEFIDPLLRYREVEKLRGTYGEGLLEAVAADGRIHATFNQTVARTGRLSSDQPNLHNIPVRTEEGRVFRTAFVPREGCSLLVADYNQIELRCIAHLADDPGLIAAFTSGQDVHRATAARVFGVKP